ncbi:alpha/beta hydrolase [Planosporangium sp. 12N6]|uniref:alpha/beta hydrolase n=1 Tax=Planosporangium spinosum TaxID=3402278 RepID=UPI003CF5B784
MRRTTRIGTALGSAAAVTVAFAPAVSVPAYAAPVTPASPAGATADWKPCTDLPPQAPAVDCATVTVPIDWSKPDGPTIGIALARQRATDPTARIGSVLVDPGGPGGSGVDWVKGGPVLSPEVNRRFDVVGFDPRGVGGSSPVRCDLDVELEPVPAIPHDRAEFDRLVAHNRALGASCRALTGPVFDFLDTASTARDMDAIRAALGESKLNYYGVSYGTLMGQQYAELFPHRIRTMVIDSNMDHSLPTTWQFLHTEAVAVEESFDQFAAWCDRTAACALHGRDVHRVFADLYDRAGRGELTIPGTDQKLDQMQLLWGATGAFYGPDWQFLAASLDELTTGRPAPAGDGRAAALFAAGDRGHGESVEDPGASIFCQDWRLPVHHVTELDAYRLALARTAPDMKLSPLAWGVTMGCAGWPAPVRNPQHRLATAGAPPVLMLNSRYDPATPYQWATNAARQMRSAVLLTYDGWGHGAYFKGSDCVVAATDTYLVTGRAPKQGTHCPAVEPPVNPRVTTQAPTQPRPPVTGRPRWTAAPAA